MLKQKMDDHASIALNGIGFIFGLLGVVGIFIQQSLTVFLPLLLPLVVCAVFCTLLINSQRNVKQTKENITPSPIRIDLIWYLDSQSWLLRGRFLFRHLPGERYGFEPPDNPLRLSFLPSWICNCEAEVIRDWLRWPYRKTKWTIYIQFYSRWLPDSRDYVFIVHNYWGTDS